MGTRTYVIYRDAPGEFRICVEEGSDDSPGRVTKARSEKVYSSRDEALAALRQLVDAEESMSDRQPRPGR